MTTPTTPRARKATAAPAAKTPDAPAAKPTSPGARIDLPGAMHILSEGEIMSPDGIYQFLEALRVVATGAAFFTESAATQLERAVRRGARENTDGRLTLEQKLKLRGVLRRVARGLNSAHDDLFAVAKDAMNAYAPLESFLEELADDRVRPQHNSRGGFDLFGGR